MHKKVGNGKQCWCPDCKKLYHKKKSAEWEEAHRQERNERFKNDEARAKRIEWAKKTKQSEKRKEYHRKRYQTNKEAMRKKMDEWREVNKDKWNAYSHKRRALLRGNGHEHYDFDEIFERDNAICGICGLPAPKDYTERVKMPTIDHILPIALGGGDTPDNVQIAHLGCNARKAHHV